jgi:acetyl-CoA carboxylase biotin carboxylase subunit
MTPELREKMGEAAVKAGKSINYEGVGTIEFLVDKYRNFYFMEMNTRIQVEHPVTEEVIDHDLIKEQIKVAAGIPKSLAKITIQRCMQWSAVLMPKMYLMDSDQIQVKSHHSTVQKVMASRVDTHVYAGYSVPPFYDSMIAKLICKAQTREDCIKKMQRALDEFVIEGIKTTMPFHKALMKNEAFKSGDFNTGFMNTLTWTIAMNSKNLRYQSKEF